MLFNLILTVVFGLNIFSALIFMNACAVSGKQTRFELEVPAPPMKAASSRFYTNASMSTSAAARA